MEIRAHFIRMTSDVSFFNNEMSAKYAVYDHLASKKMRRICDYCLTRTYSPDIYKYCGIIENMFIKFLIRKDKKRNKLINKHYGRDIGGIINKI